MQLSIVYAEKQINWKRPNEKGRIKYKNSFVLRSKTHLAQLPNWDFDLWLWVVPSVGWTGAPDETQVARADTPER